MIGKRRQTHRHGPPAAWENAWGTSAAQELKKEQLRLPTAEERELLAPYLTGGELHATREAALDLLVVVESSLGTTTGHHVLLAMAITLGRRDRPAARGLCFRVLGACDETRGKETGGPARVRPIPAELVPQLSSCFVCLLGECRPEHASRGRGEGPRRPPAMPGFESHGEGLRSRDVCVVAPRGLPGAR